MVSDECAALDDRVRSTKTKETIFLDGKPLSAVFGQYRDELYAYLLRQTAHRADADDILSETFVKVTRFHDSYQPGTNLRAWLYKIAVRTFLNHHHQKKIEWERFTSDEDPEFHAASHPETPETIVARREIMAHARRAVGELPGDFRATAWLTFFGESHYHETGRALGLPDGTVMPRVYRARRILERDTDLYNVLK